MGGTLLSKETEFNQCKSLYKIVSKFDAKLIKYIILFKDILTFLGLDYRDASLITLYFVVIDMLPKSYLIVIGITMQSLKSIVQL